MILVRTIAAFVFALAFVCQPAASSALSPASPESRVGAFEDVQVAFVGGLGDASGGLHKGIGEAYDEIASGYRFAARGNIWSATKNKTAVQNAFGHWKKHGAEFPEFRNAKEYVEGAQRFVNQPPQGVLSRVRANGDTVLYDQATNTFGVRAADGAPRTMFRPDPAQHGYPTNLEYFNAQ